MRRRRMVNEQEPKSEVVHEIEFVESIEEAIDQNQNQYQSQSGFSGWIFLIIIFVFLFWIINI